MEGKDEVELVEPQRVELGDSIKMKQVIDEAIVKAAIDMGYEEDHFINNVKLAVMTLACVFALVAQFWPQPFPESRLMLAICCGSYFACSMALQAMMSYWEEDVILVTQPNVKSGLAGGLRVTTDLPRFDEIFNVSVRERGAASEKKALIEESWNVGNFFDVEGYFDEWGCVEYASRLIERLEKPQDKPTKKGAKTRGDSKKAK